ncbi:hypothetical protein QBC32DRAFT_259112 [Pseudoneurospora amorphoporcata]|uniref:UBX domain-containing protein 2 n=1 Tax=Pseudoneurospora amorphoporcata TaxID=241081 RepID=A0AAN6NXR5_9PEZI|nr:hypothetical protein QBC32DRAFT_259112 [Pseudoneurospora amorphoporcata]
MFFTGTLQEGIAAAIQQTKSLVCFVTDDNTESQQWENEFLKDEAICPLIESSAVVLKLVAGSTEEGYLAQLFPVPKKPTVVVLRGGQLKEYIAAGVTKEDFVRRLGAALGEQQAVSPGATSGSASVQEPQSEQGQEQASSEPTAQPPAEQITAAATTSTEAAASQQPPTGTTTTTEPTAASSSSPATTTTTPNTTQQAQIQAILAERAARLAIQKKQQEEATRAAARARAAAEDPSSPARQAADALRKKQQEAREERQRILKAIEDDKAARKARQLEKQREKEALTASESGEAEDKKGKGKGKAKEEEAGLPFAPPSPMLPRGNQPIKSTGGHCALQVRLTDGSTIRSRFSAEKDTVREVREWVEATVSESPAVKNGRYTFKVLLTPQPSRRIEQEEEGKTLGELGLAPSSTLILVPTTAGSRTRVRFAGAEAGVAEGTEGGGGNIFQRLIGFLVAFFNTVVAFFSTLFSVSGPPNASATPEHVAAEVRATQAERATGRSLGGGGGGGAGAAVNRGPAGSRIQGFGDERREEERKRKDQQQFYNGNSTNFEPRRDDDEN